MNTADSTASNRPIHPDNEYSRLRDSKLPHSPEDLVAEAVALVALLFALGIGLVIAMLPVSAKAAATVQPAAPAASAPSLELAAFKVLAATPAKPEQLVSAAQAHAGDQLEYQAVYRNPTAAAMHHVLITVPVPANGVEAVLGTAEPRADLASTDGKVFAKLPLMRVETAADGSLASKPAPASDYRFLRWDLGDVPAGAVRTVRTRVQLTSASVAAR